MSISSEIPAEEIDRLVEVARAELQRQEAVDRAGFPSFEGPWADVDGAFDLRALVIAIRSA